MSKFEDGLKETVAKMEAVAERRRKAEAEILAYDSELEELRKDKAGWEAAIAGRREPIAAPPEGTARVGRRAYCVINGVKRSHGEVIAEATATHPTDFTSRIIWLELVKLDSGIKFSTVNAIMTSMARKGMLQVVARDEAGHQIYRRPQLNGAATVPPEAPDAR